MADLPLSGISLIVQNAAKATRDLNVWRAALGQQNQAVVEAAKVSSNTSKVTAALSKDFSALGKNVVSQLPGMSKFSNLLGLVGTSGTVAASGAEAAAAGTTALGASMSAALPVIGLVIAGLAATTAAFYAFWKTGQRGLQLENTLLAFRNVINGLEDTNVVLNGLRNATRGTVSDMELMRLTTATLQGQSEEFRKVLLKTENGISNLGKVFDVTARAARATGQSEEYIREKFLTGLRLQSKLRLDDIGVTVNAVQANEKYAESIGKTAAALTDAEKKQAFLTEALRQLDRIGAEAPINSVQDAIKRVGAAFQNLKDKIALLIQPIFQPIATLITGIATSIIEGFTKIVYLLAPVFEVIGAIITETFATAKQVIDLFFGGFGDSAGNTLTYVIAAFQLAGEAITEIIRIIGAGIRLAIGVFAAAFKAIGKAIGGFFGGVGEDVDLNINQLAYNLGYGGAHIIGSFAAGIIRGGTFVLRAVTSIAQIVADFLMGFSPPKRGILSTIDQGGENVAIAWSEGFSKGVMKSFGEATQFVNERLGAIAYFSREQLQGGLAALDLALRPFKESLAIVKADMQAIAGFTDPAMKILERQRTALLKAFGRGESGLDIEALRAQDRQIAQLKELKSLSEDQVDKAQLQLSLAEAQQAQQRALYQIALDRLGKEEAIGNAAKNAAKDMSKAAGGGGAQGGEGAAAGLQLGGGGIPDLLTNEDIEAAKGKIIAAISGVVASGASGISAGFADSGVSDALAGLTGQAGALKGQIGRIGEADPAKAIADKFSGIKDKLTAPLEEVRTFLNDQFKAMFGEEGTITAFLTGFGEKILSVFTGDESPITLAKNALSETLTKMAEDFLWLKDQIDEKLSFVTDFISSIFINEDSIMFKAFEGVKTLIDKIIGDEGFMRLINDGEGTLKGALTDLTDTLWNALVVPIKDALQGMANTVTRGITNLINTVGGFLGTFGVNLPTVNDIIIDLPAHVRGALSEARPFMSGERGRELIVPAKSNPLSVFPHRATMALERLSQQPAAMPMYINGGGGSGFGSSETTNNTNSYNRTVTNNFRHKPTRLELAQMRANN